MATWQPWAVQNPFFNARNSYGSPWGTSFPTTPFGQLYANQTPGVAWTTAIAPFAGGLDPFSRFVQGQEQRVEDAYKAAVTVNPDLERTQYFGGLTPDFWRQQFAQLGPRLRGERAGLYAPQQRWQRWG